MADTQDDPLRARVMNLRIEGDLHQKLSSRSAKSGRPMTTEALRLIHKGLAQEEVIGPRAESGFDLMIAFGLRGARGVIEKLMETATGAELRQFIYSVEAQSGKAAS